MRGMVVGEGGGVCMTSPVTCLLTDRCQRILPSLPRLLSFACIHACQAICRQGWQRCTPMHPAKSHELSCEMLRRKHQCLHHIGWLSTIDMIKPVSIGAHSCLQSPPAAAAGSTEWRTVVQHGWRSGAQRAVPRPVQAPGVELQLQGFVAKKGAALFECVRERFQFRDGALGTRVSPVRLTAAATVQLLREPLLTGMKQRLTDKLPHLRSPLIQRSGLERSLHALGLAAGTR